MSVYQGLQLDPAILKQYIRKSTSAREKRYYYAIMAARSVLIVAFAILFIGGLSQIFGQENTPMAVVLFCWILAVRFVNFEYCIRDSLVSLGAMLGILLVAPTLAQMAPPVLLFVLHGVAFFALLTLTSQRPELGNAGLCGFSYVYLTGNPVQGEVLLQRAGLALVGYVICAQILVKKHRGAHREVRFHHVVRRFSLTSLTHLWQVRMALGVSLVHPHPGVAADCGSAGRVRGVLCVVSAAAQRPALHDGALGRAVPGLLYRLSVQNRHELLRSVDDGNGHLRRAGCGGAAHCGHRSGRAAGHGVRLGVPPPGDGAGAARTREKNGIKR